MSTYADALAALKEQEGEYNPTPCKVLCEPGCCQGPQEWTNVTISRVVGALVLEALGTEWVDFGTFDNCRETGLTFTVPGWQFCVYEHRNSDEICVQGCRIEDVNDWGPYGGVDKRDVLGIIGYEQYETAAGHLIAALRYVNKNPDITRRELKSALLAAVTS